MALDTGVQAAIEAVMDDGASAIGLIADSAATTDQLTRRQSGSRQGDPKSTPLMHLRAGQALALAGRYDEALPHLQASRKNTALLPESEIWLYLTYQQQKNTAGQTELARRPWILVLPRNPLSNVLIKSRKLRS
jgi:predicted Zn-dependent protease